MTIRRFIGCWSAGAALGVLFVVMVASTLPLCFSRVPRAIQHEAIKSATHAKALGTLLYAEYLFPFELASLILLIAIVGAVVL